MKKVKMNFILIALIYIVSSNISPAQYPDWTVYNSSNSGLPDNNVYSIALDGSGNKWIGTRRGGIAKFDGSNWTVCDTSNSEMPDNYIRSIAIDGGGNKWFGTEQGLVKFDGINWNVYDTSNSGLPDNFVESIEIDESGNKWIGTGYGGIAKFDGSDWTVYDSINSGLPDNWVYSIAIDERDNKWIGTGYGGLAKFDGFNWTVYNTSNSGLPDDRCRSITIDESWNKWIGTRGGGIAVFKNTGSPVVEKTFGTKEILKSYPNPFSETTNINYELRMPGFVTLKIYDVLGNEVATLVNEYKDAGSHSAVFEACSLPPGMYYYTIRIEKKVESGKLVLVK